MIFFMNNYQIKKERIDSVRILNPSVCEIYGTCRLPSIVINAQQVFEAGDGYLAIDELLRVGFYTHEQHSAVSEKYKCTMSFLEECKQVQEVK